MGFNNPLTGLNGSLIYPQIKSPNFDLATQMGWAILKNGDAYFFNVVATGSVTANSVILEGPGEELLAYSGTPAAGNLVLAIAAQAGSDSFGNSWAMGVNVLSSNRQLVIGETGGNPLIYAGTGNTNIMNSGALQGLGVGAGTAEYDEWQLLGPQDKTFKDSVALQMLSSNASGTQRALAQLFYTDSTLTPHSYMQVSAAGGIVSAGSITAVQPGTGTPATPAVAETWHTIGVFGTGFAAGTMAVPRYRYMPDGTVLLDGQIVTTGAVASSATIFTLPAGYLPSQEQWCTNGTTLSGRTAINSTMVIQTSGVVVTGCLGAAAAESIFLSGVRFPVI